LTLAGVDRVEGVLVTVGAMTVVASPAVVLAGTLSISMSIHHIATNKKSATNNCNRFLHMATSDVFRQYGPFEPPTRSQALLNGSSPDWKS